MLAHDVSALDTDVIIVGPGLAGEVAASELEERGMTAHARAQQRARRPHRTPPLPELTRDGLCSNRICRVTSKPLCNIALRPNGSRLSREAEDCHHCSLDLDDLLRRQPTDSGVDVRPFDGCELVDHHITVVIKSG